MIPFHILYSWFFKSFNISNETVLIDRLLAEGYTKFMLIKRSWIFVLGILWMPLAVVMLGCLSIYIAYTSISIAEISYTLVIGNIAMIVILLMSSINYIYHFRSIRHHSEICTDITSLREELSEGDAYFVSFFNWSITNQWILGLILIIEITLVLFYGSKIEDSYWVLATDTLIILIEIGLLRSYRKRMTDMEMDYNVVVQGKIFFVNQSGFLSSTQTVEGEKIKTVQSIFPSKIASFFHYGTINILMEGDQAGLGNTTMEYVTDPDIVAANIEILADEKKEELSPQNSTLHTTIKEEKLVTTKRLPILTPEKIVLQTGVKNKVDDIVNI